VNDATTSRAPGARATHPESVRALRAAWEKLRKEAPGVRARDAAAQLGVSEAQLVACRVDGEVVTRLAADWGDVVRALPKLGRIMALTRNEHVVHEKVGAFDHVSIQPSHGLVLNHDIDLRLFLNHWRHGFAVTEDVRSGTRRSLQFFDLDGTAIHKVYLREGSDESAYDALVERFRAPQQSPGLDVLPLPARPADRPDADIDVKGLAAHWAALQDTHDFFPMLQEFGVGRLQALRLVGGELAYRVDPAAFERAVETAAEREVPIMCFVGNPGCIQIHTGPVRNIKRMGPWFNVLDEGFNLHLRTDAVAETWVVRKPSRDGIVTSLEVFDASGFNFVQFFGERKPGRPELESWRAIVQMFGRPRACA
jgi:putative hemin transport protein